MRSAPAMLSLVSLIILAGCATADPWLTSASMTGAVPDREQVLAMLGEYEAAHQAGDINRLQNAFPLGNERLMLPGVGMLWTGSTRWVLNVQHHVIGYTIRWAEDRVTLSLMILYYRFHSFAFPLSSSPKYRE